MKYFKLTKPMILLAFPLALILTPSPSKAQDNPEKENSFSLSGQLRPRLEFRDGNFQPLTGNQKPAALISERIRFTMDYTYKDLLTVRISPQTVGIWGQESMVQGVESSGNKIALFEAWSRLKLSPYWDVKLGRQVISLDDERIFGELDWAQGARAHDALSFNYKKDKYEFRSFFGYNQNYKVNYNNNLNNPSGNIYNTTDAFTYKWMQTLWASLPLSQTSKISLLFANIGFQNSTPAAAVSPTRFTQTYGVNLHHNADQWNLTVSAYYQGGKDLSGKTTSAYLLSAYANLKATEKLTVGIGSDMLSGNSVGSLSEKDNVFNPYFHTGHKFYGSMDYFNNGNSIGGAGLSDSYLKANYAANDKLNLGLALHQFLTPNKVSDITQEYSKNLGQEADISFGLKVNKLVDLTGGYSFYLANSTLNFLKNITGAGKWQQWAWLSLNVTPQFFKGKW